MSSPTDVSKAELSRNILRETLVLVTSTFVQSAAVARVVAMIPQQDLEPRIYFLQAYMDFVRSIPEKIYPNLENRGKLLEAIQEHLGDLIEQEEDGEIWEE